MKIAMIGTKGIPAKWGGIEVYIQEIAGRLVNKGHEVAVYSRRWFSGNAEDHAGIKILTTPTIKTKSTDALLHGLTSSVHASLSKFDVVHYHGLASYFYPVIPRMVGKKTLITMHANSWVEPKWNSLAVNTLKTATKIGINVANAVTTISPVLKEFIAGISDRDVILTPPGINIGIYREPLNITRDYGLKTNEYVLFMGRLDTVKRIDLLINAFKALEDLPYKLVITGDPGPSDGLQYRDLLVEAAKYDSRIIFTGFQSGIIKEELLSNCRLFVLPSMNEGVPLALLEGMSYGRPCLASDIPAHSYIIMDGINGFLANGDSVEDFKQKLKMVLTTDTNKLNPVGRQAVEYVAQNFNWDNTVDNLEKVYLNLLSNR